MKTQGRFFSTSGARRVSLLVGSTAITALLLAGCSGGNDGNSGDGGDQTLRVLIAQPQAGAGEILEKDFEADTGIEVEVTVVPYDQIQTKALLDVQSGTNQFDVIQYWYTSVGALAEGGALDDITEWIDDELDAEDFIPSLYDAYTLYEGQRYGVPIDGDTHVLFYNTEIFERNGVTPPTTWEEYIQVAKTITENEKANGIYGSALLGAKNAFNIGSTFFNRLATFSAKPIDSQFPDLSTPEALAAAQSMLDASPYALPSPLEIGFEQALPQFLGGNVGMIEFWTDLGVFAQDPAQSKVIDKWGVVPLPVGPNGKTSAAMNAGWAMGISPNASDRKLAEKFVAFASSAATNEKLSTTFGSGVDPTRFSTLESAKYQELVPEVAKVSAEVLPAAQPWPTSPQAPEMISALNDNLALMLQGNLTPKEALANTTAAWEAL